MFNVQSDHSIKHFWDSDISVGAIVPTSIFFFVVTCFHEYCQQAAF